MASMKDNMTLALLVVLVLMFLFSYVSKQESYAVPGRLSDVEVENYANQRRPLSEVPNPADVQYNDKQEQPKVESVDISWPPVMSFVKSGSPFCQDLFARDFQGGEKQYNQKFQREMDRLHDFIRVQLNTTRIEGNSVYHMEEGLAYWELIYRTSSTVRTICETGFNAGHSTLLWLMANKHANVFSFDLGEHDYSRHIAKYLANRFDNRLHVTWGDSRKTLPKFREQHPDVKCDVVIIDGGHTIQIANSDWYNFCYMSKMNTMLILDNYPDKRWGYDYGDFGIVWELGKQHGDIAELFRCAYSPDVHGFTIGRVSGNQCQNYKGNYTVPHEPPRVPVLNVRVPGKE